MPFLYNVVAVSVSPVVGGLTLQQNIPGYSIRHIMIPDLMRDWLAFAMVFAPTYFVKTLMPESFLRLVIIRSVSTLLACLATYFVVFPSNRRYVIINFIKDKIWKRNH